MSEDMHDDKTEQKKIDKLRYDIAMLGERTFTRYDLPASYGDSINVALRALVEKGEIEIAGHALTRTRRRKTHVYRAVPQRLDEEMALRKSRFERVWGGIYPFMFQPPALKGKVTVYREKME